MRAFLILKHTWAIGKPILKYRYIFGPNSFFQILFVLQESGVHASRHQMPAKKENG
jgi:hypothetical protein